MKTKIVNGVSLFALTLLSLLFLTIYLPKIFGICVYYVETDSMKPTLCVGDAAFTKEVLFEDIKKGDIVTFTDDSGTRFCTHRVVEVKEKSKSFVTKGDNNNIYDPFDTSFKYVKGKMVFKLPALGYIFKLLNTTAARISVTVLAVVLLAIEIEIYKTKKKGVRQE